METNLLPRSRFLKPWPGLAWLAMCCVAALLAGGAAAFGQAIEPAKPTQPTQPTAKTHPNDPMVWNVDQMMEDAVLQISRRYNLNKAQEGYTRLLLRRRVNAFLEVHEDDVRQLLKESIDFRFGLKDGTVEAYKDWAERAMPVYEAAKKAILDGNMEWGEILTAEQKVLHKKDLDQMDANFKQVTSVLGDMREGKIPSWAPRKQSQATGAPGKTRGQVSPNPPNVEVRFVEDNWLDYVETFIRTYKLDEKQQNSARAIHKEVLAQATVYRAKRRIELAKIEAELKLSTKGPKDEKDPKKDKERREELRRRKARLEKPVRQMFIVMNRRLAAMLRAEQLTNADAEQKKILDAMYERLSGEHDDKHRAVTGVKRRPDTKPAETSPDDAKPEESKPESATSKPAQSEDARSPGGEAKDAGPKDKADSKAKPAKPAEAPKASHTPPDPASGKPTKAAEASNKSAS